MSENSCSLLLGFSIRWGNPLSASPCPPHHQVPVLLGCSATSAPAEPRHCLSQLLQRASGAFVVSHGCSRWRPLLSQQELPGSSSHECARGVCHEVSQLRASWNIVLFSTSIPPVAVILTFLLHVSYRSGAETKVLPQSRQVVRFSYLSFSDLAFRSSTDNAQAQITFLKSDGENIHCCFIFCFVIAVFTEAFWIFWRYICELQPL